AAPSVTPTRTAGSAASRRRRPAAHRPAAPMPAGRRSGPSAWLCELRVETLRVDPQLANQAPQLVPVGRAGEAQTVERGVGDVLRRHLEMRAQRLARVAAPEAVRAQDRVRPIDPP